MTTARSAMNFKPVATGRIYNPETSRYELPTPPDPWAGAPTEALAKGIRLMSSDGNAGIWTDTHSYWKASIPSFAPWTPCKHTGLQHCLDANRVRGYRFPDFDGAPEGTRFYARWAGGTRWVPRVVDRALSTRIWAPHDGAWSPARRPVGWYRGQGWSLLFVDEEPTKPEALQPMTFKAPHERGEEALAEYISGMKMYFRADTLEHLQVASLDDLLDEIRRRLREGEIPPFKREAA